MRSVGLFEIKNRLSAFVERASQGEEITITRRGQPVAMLVPAAGRSNRSARVVVDHLRAVRKGARLPKGYTIRRLIEEGRRS